MSVRNRRGKVCSRILHKCVRRKIITKFSLLISDFLPYIFYILYVCIIKVIKVANSVFKIFEHIVNLLNVWKTVKLSVYTFGQKPFWSFLWASFRRLLFASKAASCFFSSASNSAIRFFKKMCQTEKFISLFTHLLFTFRQFLNFILLHFALMITSG